MQPYSLAQTLAAVSTLNTSDQPFHYRVENNQIIGEWKYLDATWAAPLAGGNADKEFRINITLDEASHTYTSKDHQSANASKLSFNPMNGNISFGKSTDGFSGHTIGKQIGFGLGQANQSQNETGVGGPTYQYFFSTAQIKDPLFGFLAQTGWTKAKTGLFGKLFGRS